MRNHTTAVIIGGGQAGLAMSAVLSERSIDHVVLERGQVAHSWRTERWDSLRLLTPNWMTRLPGHQYGGADPDGYMTAADTAAFIDGYAAKISAPVITEAPVDRVRPLDDGRFLVTSAAGEWIARSVIDATGACSTPRRPDVADLLPATVQQLTPNDYRNPDGLADGRVLVVGVSASGAQIADEIARSGRDVTVACGHHVRVPRTYRGMDIHWWMDAAGILDESWTDVDDIARARRVPSLQLVGSPDRRDLDLSTLQRSGVTIAGRLAGVTSSTIQFSGSLANTIESAELKLGRLLDQLDGYATVAGLADELPEPDRPAPVDAGSGPLTMDLAGVGAVVWATGYVAHHPALPPEVLDRKGAVRHEGGVVTDLPGLYVLGRPFMRRRKSSFLDGVGRDADDLGVHIAQQLDQVAIATR